MENAIATHSLQFAFQGEEPVIRQLDLAVPLGSTFGVLGPNGAGKSTLLKLLLGLLTPGQGSVSLFEQSFDRFQPQVFQRVGSFIEEPHLYGHLTGRENLRVFATYRGLPATRIDEALATVGLNEVAGKRVRHYSTGMKQRLAIALALLPDPDLLILDEPTNGLDPEGIVDVRELILRLNRENGKTIVLSSHLLGEVEQTCSHVAILREGDLLFQGPLPELRRFRKDGLRVELDVKGTWRLGKLTEKKLGDWPCEIPHEEKMIVTVPDRKEIPLLIDRLRNEGILIYQVVLREERLEDYFLQLSKNGPPKRNYEYGE